MIADRKIVFLSSLVALAVISSIDLAPQTIAQIPTNNDTHTSLEKYAREK
jgi:hypothetical protein